MKKDNILPTLSYLALKMENTEITVLEAIAPDAILHLDSALIRDDRYIRRKKISEKGMDDIVNNVKKVAQYLGVTPLKAALMVVAFNEQLQDQTISWDDVRSFFNVKSMVLFPIKKEFDQLVEDNYLTPSYGYFSSNYNISPIVMKAVLSGSKFNPKDLKKTNFDRYKFIDIISDLIENHNDNDISALELDVKVETFESKHKNLSFLNNIKKLELDSMTRLIFYKTCNDFIKHEDTEITSLLNDLYDDQSTCFRITKELVNEKHILQTLDLIELKHDEIFSENSVIILSDKGKKLFLEEDFELFTNTKRSKDNVLYPESIKEKILFYEDALERQLKLFSSNLEQDKFTELQMRLEEKSLSKGVIALFHGAPGTGKTETAMQIAKKTGRAIYHVDIASSKSCWFGESEKLIKGIFTDYAKLCKNENMTPILLFNEADALFSKRKDVNSSNVAQTENAIQNIILEEMEKLDGIMIATTNLTDNLDKAFARRFLFKIKFGQPTVSAKKAIWKSKLEWLDDRSCEKLAESHDFSGGEIENIARKIIMEEVISGVHPTLADIEELCRNEKLDGTNGNAIGFKK